MDRIRHGGDCGHIGLFHGAPTHVLLSSCGSMIDADDSDFPSADHRGARSNWFFAPFAQKRQSG
jgi:hypothetical protein